MNFRLTDISLDLRDARLDLKVAIETDNFVLYERAKHAIRVCQHNMANLHDETWEYWNDEIPLTAGQVCHWPMTWDEAKLYHETYVLPLSEIDLDLYQL